MFEFLFFSKSLNLAFIGELLFVDLIINLSLHNTISQLSPQDLVMNSHLLFFGDLDHIAECSSLLDIQSTTCSC